jgi:hypothetical protein
MEKPTFRPKSPEELGNERKRLMKGGGKNENITFVRGFVRQLDECVFLRALSCFVSTLGYSTVPRAFDSLHGVVLTEV